MNELLTNQLLTKYPKIFQISHEFDCGDGWYNLIDTMCFLIQRRIEKSKTGGEEIEQVIATRVKEKFATLRFHYTGGDDHISGVVSFATTMSGTVCETTGDVGVTRITANGLMKTASDKVAESQNMTHTKDHSSIEWYG